MAERLRTGPDGTKRDGTDRNGWRGNDKRTTARRGGTSLAISQPVSRSPNGRNPYLGANENLLVLHRQGVEGGLHLCRAKQQGLALGLDVSEAKRLRDEALRAAALNVINYGLSRNSEETKNVSKQERRKRKTGVAHEGSSVGWRAAVCMRGQPTHKAQSQRLQGRTVPRHSDLSCSCCARVVCLLLLHSGHIPLALCPSSPGCFVWPTL